MSADEKRWFLEHLRARYLQPDDPAGYDRLVKPEQVAALLCPILEGGELRLAVLFGSAARDALRADSDIDVAILPKEPGMALSGELALQGALERALGRQVDLVRLDRTSTLLRWRVAREGLPILATPPREWPHFVAQAGIEHGDFAPVYRRAAERFRRRLASAGGHG